ncbi:MAG: FAD:protein FMN transferase [Clostridium sp.]|jgi:thiamine biosynthesis lipoprotein
MNKKDITALCTLLAVVLLGCGAALLLRPKEATPVSRSAFLLNTFVNITLYDSDDEAILDRCMELCEEYESRFSKTIKGSELYRLNHRSPDETTFTLSDDMTAMIQKSLDYSRLSEGAYDLTIEPLSSLWNFTDGKHTIPSEEDIEAAAARVNWQDIQLEGNTLTFLSPDTTIDLGSIAKGYIADRLKEYLVSQGVKSAIINLGGNVLCVGKMPNRSSFLIGLQMPFEDYATVFANLSIDDMSVVSSGVYERHFELDGVNYHHLLNPKTGYPYDNGLIAVTIVSPDSVDGDVLSTVCFSMGLEKGLELLNSMDGIYGYFVTEDYDLIYSDGAEQFVHQTAQ